MTQELLTRCIGYAAQCGKMDDVAELTGILNDTYINPPVEKRTRAAGNKSGYVQLDAETGAKVGFYATIKEAVAALNAERTEDEKTIREDSSCISQACRNFKDGKSNKAYGYAWVYGDDYKA